MKIRSITICDDIERADPEKVRSFFHDARGSYTFEIETRRFSTIPQNNRFKDGKEAIEKAIEYDGWAIDSKVDYIGGFGLGTYPKELDLKLLKWLPAAIQGTERVFSNCQIVDGNRVNLKAIEASAKLIKALSEMDDGFSNLRFASLFNCKPNNPYFPASYASGDISNFTIAIEAADIAKNSFCNSNSLAEARENLVFTLRNVYCNVLSTSLDLEEKYGIKFYGMDFTLAPTPDIKGSIANAIENFGIERFGSNGTLFLSAFIADCIKSLGSEAGFSGIMYPVLEDGVIAKRVMEGNVSLDSLLLYSSVCGTGLDCVPLPGEITEEKLQSILFDLAGLSVRLRKQLTARLFPIPGKKAGDMTEFGFSYFANTSVMDVKGGISKFWDDPEYTFNL